MKYGCIGAKLRHSFSKEIHNRLADYQYELCEVDSGELGNFMKARDFLGINVTIPYKEAVLPYLHYIDDSARLIGAVNTIVNRDGLLYGYNTDFYGMSSLLAHADIDVAGKCVAILGTGGTGKTARAVCESLGANELISVSRQRGNRAIDYSDFLSLADRVEVIINTTPVGMFPNGGECPVAIDDFPRLLGVIDAIYNPLCTNLVLSAKEREIPAEGGLYMLVAQAVRASEIFTDTKYSREGIDSIYQSILQSKENIVLIGMPACGKSTVGKMLAQNLGRELIDTDDLIEDRVGRKISDIFASEGEAVFRNMESDAIRDVSQRNGLVIATGGGAVLRDENVRLLKQNGRLFFLDRAPDKLIPTSSRPLASNIESIQRRYAERYPRYLAVADETVNCNIDVECVAEFIGEKYK